MSITSITQKKSGLATAVTAASDLVPSVDVVWFYFFLDGVYLQAVTGNPSATVSLVLPPDDQGRVDVLDSLDPPEVYDPLAHAPTRYPARRTITWTRSADPTVVRYRVEQQKNAGSWSEIGRVAADPSLWQYQLLTPRLEDLATYAWRIYPVDAAGNDGTAVTLGSEKIVRAPDCPDFAVAFDEGTTRVTFS